MLKPWEKTQSFDEGGGYESIYVPMDDPIDTLFFNGDVITDVMPDPQGFDLVDGGEIVTSFGKGNRVKTRTGTYVSTPIPINYEKLDPKAENVKSARTWLSDDGMTTGHFLGEQNVFVTQGTINQQSTDWFGDAWVDGGEGNDETMLSGEAGEGGGIWNKMNDAINPFAWFGQDPIRDAKEVVTGALPIMTIIMLMMVMKE